MTTAHEYRLCKGGLKPHLMLHKGGETHRCRPNGEIVSFESNFHMILLHVLQEYPYFALQLPDMSIHPTLSCSRWLADSLGMSEVMIT